MASLTSMASWTRNVASGCSFGSEFQYNPDVSLVLNEAHAMLRAYR